MAMNHAIHDSPRPVLYNTGLGWSGRRESNPQSHPPEGCALPLGHAPLDAVRQLRIMNYKLKRVAGFVFIS